MSVERTQKAIIDVAPVVATRLFGALSNANLAEAHRAALSDYGGAPKTLKRRRRTRNGLILEATKVLLGEPGLNEQVKIGKEKIGGKVPLKKGSLKRPERNIYRLVGMGKDEKVEVKRDERGGAQITVYEAKAA